MTKLKYTYVYNLLLSIGLGLFIIYLIPDFFNKYKVRLADQSRLYTSETLIWYNDLNNDGFSEKIYRGVNGGSQTPYLKFDDKGEYFIEQWNISGEWIQDCPLMIGDFDNNGYKEVFALSYKNDSIFLNGVEPYKNDGLEIRGRFVFKAQKNNNNQDWDVYSNHFVDLNNDGYKEVVFSFLAGFSKQPRKLVAYDIKHDSFLFSSYAGTCPEYFNFSDIDADGQTEIFGRTYAKDNYAESIPLTDTNSYLLIYGNDLKLKYPPDTNYGVSSSVFAVPFNDNIVTVWLGRTSINNIRALKIYNYNTGKVEKTEKDVSHLLSGIPHLSVLRKKQIDQLYLSGKNGKVFQFNKNLEQIAKSNLNMFNPSSIVPIDFENDGTDEIICYSLVEGRASIFRADFKHPVNIVLSATGKLRPQFSIRKRKGLVDQVSISYGQNWQLWDYYKNPNYMYRWPIYFAIVLLLFAFFELLFKFYKRRIQKQYETERKLLELQLLTVKNQMNPHFTFNALNSISSIIYKEDKKLAHDFLTRFSDLIRSTLQNAKNISILLGEELKFVENYLELEKFRFKNKFSYSIDVSDEVDYSTIIPRMIIQTFVENAIKHGLMHLEKGGLLKIKIKNASKQLIIEIEDNGIGRKKAKEVSLGSTGRGLIIIEQIVFLYKKLKGKQIKYKVIDLLKDGKAAGTKIIIEVTI